MNESRRSILRKASALSALAVGASATASAADCSGVSEWDSTTAYNGGDQVTHDGDLFTAEWWTKGEEPDGSKSVWTNEGACDGSGGGGGSETDCSGVSAWDSSTAYNGGDQVTHDGQLWTAEWWTQGTEPAESEAVWTLEGACTTNEAPTASFTVSPSNPAPGESVTFDASGSSDPDGTISSYSWEFGDGTSGSGESTTHTYDAAQVVTVTLTVTDDGGETASTTQDVTIGDPNAAPTASFTNDPASPEPGQTATFDASGSGDSDGSIASYEWEFGDGTTATGQTVDHTFASEGTYSVTLTVTDDDGATGTTTTDVSVTTGPSDEFKVIGYYPGWKASSPYDYYPEDIPWDKVTDVQYAFLGVDASAGEPTIMSTRDEENLQTFKELKSGPASDTRVTLSIGGWEDSEGFSQIAGSSSKRQSFADRCVEILRQYDLDGIDIDWEHPGSSQGKCQCGSNEDYETHVDLLQAIRDALDAAGQEDGKQYHLSVANGGSDWNAGGLRHGEIGEVCDYTSIMAYDFTGSWMDQVGQNAPLYGTQHPLETTEYGTQYQNQYYVEYAVDKLYGGEHDETGYWPGQWEYPPAPPAEYNELVLGLPFYGRGFNGTEMYGSYSGLPEGTWHSALEDGADPTGAFDYGDIEENMEGASGWNKSRHDPGAVPYIVNESEETIISYDDAQSIAEKVSFAKERGMQGVMFWELSQDWNHTLLDAILAEI
ncbi:glycoside hydrolase family protein [Salinarchaeum sp. Harcht-Bsk1]|uniref:glycosyl hydrolase family 18 protein n=1 Tax=Salinarchaeum sp. Harcht-Bsk1 TaxID=1333523 RepID=UPI0003423EE6|nr:glycosyl hydrolase family 18 protein [Salinarchaeum sp. Harcht-Bsk1]AGN00771.1 glycoside hydrolase family protein [Salinarchaeum sp. Harcht-Bsk1]